MTEHTQIASSANARPFFSLGAKYLIDPTNNSVGLQGDAGCLIATAEATLQVLIAGLSDPQSELAAQMNDIITLLHSVKYQLQMVGNMVEAMEVCS